MKAFNKNIASKKIKIQKNKDTYIKRLSISLSCMFLIIVVMLFAFAKYVSNSPEYTLINGKVESPYGDFNVVSYIYDGTTNNVPPNKNDGYILTDLTCTGATGEWDDVNWSLKVSNLTNKVKCTLTFDDQSSYQIIEFNPDGGYLADQYIKATIGQPIGSLPTPIKTGYTFDGWYTSVSGGTKVEATTNVTSSLNTLYARYGGSGQPSADFTLLWTNPATTSGASSTTTFAAQTISLDLSNYDSVCVVTVGRTYGGNSPLSIYNIGRYVNTYINVGSTSRIGSLPESTATTYYTGGHRNATVTTTGVTFSAPRGYVDGSVPMYIYGIKGLVIPSSLTSEGIR